MNAYTYAFNATTVTPANATSAIAYGPEIILGSVNTYLDQFEPITLLLFTLVASTVIYAMFPRVNYLVAASFLSLVLAELFRMYRQDFEAMDTTSQTLYVTGSTVAIGLFTFCLGMAFY